jgi:PilZ domain
MTLGISKPIRSDPSTANPAAHMEQRQSPRYGIDAPAIMRVQGRPGPFLVTLLDVSSSGLRMSSPSAFPVGAKVAIKCLGVEIAGEIRYARPVDDGSFHIGVLAEAVSGAGDLDLVRLLRQPGS